jgi:hypothetical protein
LARTYASTIAAIPPGAARSSEISKQHPVALSERHNFRAAGQLTKLKAV